MFMIFSRCVINFISSCHSDMYIYIHFLTKFLITYVDNVKVHCCVQAGHKDEQDEDLA